MIFIGERINTGFTKIKEAVIGRNAEVIMESARTQVAAGADYLDVNLGAVSNKPEDLIWMIETVQQAVDVPICIDNNKPQMLKEAIKVCKQPPLVNSVIADERKLDEMLPIVAQYDASIIGLAMDESGSPATADKRVENAGLIVTKLMEHEIPTNRLFLDPIVMPLKFMQNQALEILRAASQFSIFAEPPCHIVCGLSNISSGTIHKGLINRIFAVMMVANELDAVIMNVNDKDLVDAILTSELIMNRYIYADSYLEAFRK